MPEGKKKSRTYRRIPKKLPGGRITTQYKKRKPSRAQCAECGAVLAGVPRERPFIMRSISKTQKRPERPYGGVLCSKCMRRKIINNIQ